MSAEPAHFESGAREEYANMQVDAAVRWQGSRQPGGPSRHGARGPSQHFCRRANPVHVSEDVFRYSRAQSEVTLSAKSKDPKLKELKFPS